MGRPPACRGRSASFCSNRYSNGGCGRTFPAYWEGVLPGCQLRTHALLTFITALVALEGNVCAARRQTGDSCGGRMSFPLSISSAYRWKSRWRANTAGLRSALYKLRPPPVQHRGDGIDSITLRHLLACFGTHRCALAAFQSTFQAPAMP